VSNQVTSREIRADKLTLRAHFGVRPLPVLETHNKTYEKHALEKGLVSRPATHLFRIFWM
jgi:hypothetical protein